MSGSPDGLQERLGLIASARTEPSIRLLSNFS
jgi:hypothetical protein